jgi:methylmalonyl-CoA mutase N-terminal domain/subunit
VEALTDELEGKTFELFKKIQGMGGAVAGIENGFFDKEIKQFAYEELIRMESGEKVVVDVNKYTVVEPLKIDIRKIDPKEEERQGEKLKKLRQERNNENDKSSLKRIEEAAKDGINLVPSLLEAGKAYATIGEMCDSLRKVYGDFKATTF